VDLKAEGEDETHNNRADNLTGTDKVIRHRPYRDARFLSASKSDSNMTLISISGSCPQGKRRICKGGI
jgi:hypothetical protein